MFIKEKLRPYEISLWTLQDSFITVLKAYDIYSKGQIETPKCKIKNDGTQELSFSIPMYYYEDGLLVENPIWYNVINGTLIANLRKIKVIFNKGELEEEVFEFVINKVVETHSDGQLKCEITAEGLAFQELGKVGYKISLASQDFLNEYQDWYNSTVGTDTDKEKFDYQTEEEKEADKPKNNINYWCDKIFKNSYWTYEIQMDWSSFDGIIVDDISGSYIVPDEEGNEKSIIYNGTYQKAPKEIKEAFNKKRERNLRRLDRVYEEEYVSSWELEGSELDGILIPTRMENFKEKFRLIDLEKSNMYNLTQNLAETFGIFCKYKYDYDENYHIIGKRCIFYNNFLAEQDGTIDIIYPFSASKIEREIDSADIVTKMFVTTIEDNTSPSGLITIADASANKMREDYILNFDYLHSIGTVTDEQYKAIEDYERSMYLKNIELEPIAMQIANLQSDLANYEAQKTFAAGAKIQDQEQMDQAKETKSSIMSDQKFLVKAKETPLRGTLLRAEEEGKYYVNITQEGIDYKGENTYALSKRAHDTGMQDEEGKPIIEEKTTWVKGIRLFYYKKVDETIDKVLTYYEDDSNNNPDTEENLYPDPIPIYPSSVGMEFTNGNLTRLTNLVLKEDAVSNSIFITCTYSPSLHYQNIYEHYAKLYVEHNAMEEEALSKIKEINDKLEKLEKKYNELLEEKAVLIADFENMMGPALREGSWQAENYTDYGSKYEQQVKIGETNNKALANFIWDKEAFDEEQLLYYPLSGAENNQEYYLAIDLSDAMKVDKFKEHINDLSFIYDKVVLDENENPTETILSTHQMIIGSKACYAFIQEKTADENGQEILNIRPILLLLDKNFDKENKSNQNFRIGIVETKIVEDKVVEEVDNFGIAINWVDSSNGVQVYPRIKIDSLLLKTSEDELVIKYDNKTLRDYYDYSVLIRKESYFITLKNNLILDNGLIEGKTFDIAYAISNAALSLYLDALEVSKTNGSPQVSYKIEVSGMNKNFIKTAYNSLNRIVNINDIELKFENVQGYISELDLDLDNPWEDEITVQNYKTKFEDLFSTIVASSEQMKVNSFAYNTAASAFGGGTLKPSVLQNAINQTDLTYAFQSGNLTIDELNGIWARSDTGVVAMRGGGIFCATEQDTNGNWLWNTGIMPSGINASLITAGQIDTNLIKIFAGENLRLQLNAEGLYAYKVNSLGEADLNRYIVHNSEGLFSTIVNGEKEINLVEVSWNGFILRDKEDKIKFHADPDGNLFLSGEIQASTGNIGNWKITPNGLKYGETAGLIPASGDKFPNGHTLAGHEKMFWVTGTDNGNGEVNEFVVTTDGTLYCNDIIAKGTIAAGSYIGNTTVGEIDNQLRNISIGVLDGTTFIFDNKNYDSNVIVSPRELKFVIKTNALTNKELTSADDKDDSLDYNFYYSFEEEGDNWTLISPEDTTIVRNLNYLTFIVKSDIMYKGLDLGSAPHSMIRIKVEKNGRIRVIRDNQESFEEHSYSEIIRIIAELNGAGKYITLMNPQSYTFIEENNNNIQDELEQTKTFSLDLTGFSREELEQAYWLVNNGAEKRLDFALLGGLIDATAQGNSSVIASTEKLIIEDTEVIDGDTIDGRGEESSLQDGVFIRLIENGPNSFTASLIISRSLIPIGGNAKIIFCLNSARREAFCFRVRNGIDSVSISLKSSSGSILTNGDLSTELKTEITYGSQIVNEEDSELSFYYVWKKDNVALSKLPILVKKIEIVPDENNQDEPEIKETYELETLEIKNKIVPAEFFSQKKINVSIKDFELKAEYSCVVFDNESDARTEYLLMNENLDDELI